MPKILQDINIGKNIQKVRKARKMTQADLVAALDDFGRDMSINTLSMIEHNKRNIYASDLRNIKQILDVSFDELFIDAD